jgi:palmitoyl-protein thioesterase
MRILSPLLLTFATLTRFALAFRNSAADSDDDDDTPLPLIIWHGLGDSYQGEGMQQIGQLAEQVHEGTWVHYARVEDDASADRSASFWGNVTEQVAKVCADVAADPILSTAPAMDALGFSQGGVFLRAFAERCPHPPVRSLVTFGSPHSGIVDFRACEPSDWLCRGAMGLLKSNVWGAFTQSRLVPAQYYRDSDPESGGPSDQYLTFSNFLADVNNERAAKNGTYARNLARLRHFAMYMFEDDVTVIPKESAWFSDVDTNSGNVTRLRHRTLYQQDWLGLKQIDEKGGLHFKTTPGGHMQLDDDVLIDAMKTYFGPLSKSGKTGKESRRLDL